MKTISQKKKTESRTLFSKLYKNIVQSDREGTDIEISNTHLDS